MRKKPLNIKQKDEILIAKKQVNSTVYYLDDPTSKTGTTAVKESVMLEAVLSIAKKQGLLITEEMILYEIYGERESGA